MNKVILKRAARALGAVLVGFAAAWLVGPDGLSLIPDQYEALVIAIVVPGLLALEKYLRDGGDASA